MQRYDKSLSLDFFLAKLIVYIVDTTFSLFQIYQTFKDKVDIVSKKQNFERLENRRLVAKLTRYLSLHHISTS